MKSRIKDGNNSLDKIIGIFSKELSQSSRSENSREIAKQILAKSKESVPDKNVVTTYQLKKPLFQRLSFAYIAAAVVIVSLTGVIMWQVFSDQDEVITSQGESTSIENEVGDIVDNDITDNIASPVVVETKILDIKELDFMPLFLNTKAFSHSENKEKSSSNDRIKIALNITETTLRDNNITLKKHDPEVYKSEWTLYKNDGKTIKSRLILKLLSDDEPGIKFYEEISDIDQIIDNSTNELLSLSYSDMIIKIKKEYYKKIE